MCCGGEKPAASRTSISPNVPPVLCAVALTVIRVPRNQVASPSSGPTTKGLVLSRIGSAMTSSFIISVSLSGAPGSAYGDGGADGRTNPSREYGMVIDRGNRYSGEHEHLGTHSVPRRRGAAGRSAALRRDTQPGAGRRHPAGRSVLGVVLGGRRSGDPPRCIGCGREPG